MMPDAPAAPAAADAEPTTMDVSDPTPPLATVDAPKTLSDLPTPVVPSTVVADTDAAERASDDGVLVTAADALDASSPAGKDKTTPGEAPSEVEAVTRELASMGFT